MGCYCDGPEPDFYNAIDRTAAKDHKCCECNKPIKKGSQYRDISGKWDDFQAFKMCESCSDIWDNLTALGYCNTHTLLVEDYQEYLDGINSDKAASDIMGCVYTN